MGNTNRAADNEDGVSTGSPPREPDARAGRFAGQPLRTAYDDDEIRNFFIGNMLRSSRNKSVPPASSTRRFGPAPATASSANSGKRYGFHAPLKPYAGISPSSSGVFSVESSLESSAQPGRAASEILSRPDLITSDNLLES